MAALGALRIRPASRRPSFRPTMRILLVEDDEMLAGAVNRALTQSAHAVDTARTGLEADRALATNEYDLVLLDVGPAPDRRLRGAETPAPAAQFRARAHADRARRPGRPRHGARSRRRRLHHEAVPSFGAGSAGAGADTPRACERQIRPRPRPAAARHGGTAPVLRRAAARAVDAGDRRERSSCSCARARSSPSSSSSITSTDGRAPRPATPWRWSSTRLRKKLEPSGVEIRTVRGMGYIIEKPRQNPPQ